MMLARVHRRKAMVAVAASALLAAAGCGENLKGDRADLVNGKQLFAEKCGSCHALERANAKGTVGPSLDAAFAQSRVDGLGSDTIRGVVRDQILFPAQGSTMPAKLVEGQDATDVAAYVAHAAAVEGEDEGALATAVKSVEQKTVAAQGGKLEIPADPSGQLLYLVGEATAAPGALEIDSPNESSTPHDIALQRGDDGPTIADGPTVSGGGVSTVSVNLEKGVYTFYCTLPGHREGGMEGKLTVR